MLQAVEEYANAKTAELSRFQPIRDQDATTQ